MTTLPPALEGFAEFCQLPRPTLANKVVHPPPVEGFKNLVLRFQSVSHGLFQRHGLALSIGGRKGSIV
jgi:hypothetical protein